MTYLQFAYKVRFSQQQVQAVRAKLPRWGFSDLFAIEAKADGLPTKDQFRLMMRSLLAERFHLQVHFENQETAVYALTLVKPGRMGPRPRLHRDGSPCENSPPTAFPPECYATILAAIHPELGSNSEGGYLPLSSGRLAMVKVVLPKSLSSIYVTNCQTRQVSVSTRTCR